MLDVQKFHQINQSNFGKQVFYYPEIDSTNRVAAEKAKERVQEGSIVIADSQSAGRGRGTHHWFSPADVNLYFTVILYPENSYLHFLPFMSALAISKALERQGIRSDLKWPNDILAQGKKIAGVLIQTSMEENKLQFALVGIGVNVNVQSFPEELKGTAISASQLLGTMLDREAFLASLLEDLEHLYSNRSKISWSELGAMVRERSSYLTGCEVEVDQEGRKITGITAGLDRLGGLILLTTEGTETVYAGEISSCRKK